MRIFAKPKSRKERAIDLLCDVIAVCVLLPLMPFFLVLETIEALLRKKFDPKYGKNQ